ncbi:hypothetical protein CWC27_09370, partial [Pseudoalteromonas sp. S4491]
GHRQAPNKRKPDSKESGFFAFEAVSFQPGRLGRAERNPTRVSELQVSKGKVELCGCLVQSHSKLTLLILLVGWVERSETQHELASCKLARVKLNC